MTNIAYIVDGDMEKRFIHDACKGSPIRKVGNGDKFPTAVLAKKIMAEINLLSNRIHEFIVLLDLEERSASPGDFAHEIVSELRAAGLGNQKVTVIIKEREIEDWILADPTAISEFIGGLAIDTTGISGKGGLSKLLKVHGIKYNEVTVGYKLLKMTYCSRASQRSSSMLYMRHNFPNNCWWLSR